MAAPFAQNTLFFGDNLDVLRDNVPSESVDLVYLDPPFNSNRKYNVLFKDEWGKESTAQDSAFEDSWHWTEATEYAYHSLITHGTNHVAALMGALRNILQRSPMMAYLVMMAARLVELHRVLKPTGSLYLHCDPTASHYLKIILDAVFDPVNYRNEIIWKRTSAHSDTKQGRVVHMGRIHDVLLFYTKSQHATRNELYQPYSEDYVSGFYRHVDENGRRYRLGDITGPGGASKGNPQYEFLGVTRYWRYSKARMQELYEQGRIIQTKAGGVPQYKRYLDEMPGVPLQDVWDDIQPIGAQAAERLGYPTQKPLSLMERIIQTSSNPGDVVLDPFAGCGTTIAAAQKLNRRWLGIDITYLAIAVLKYRLENTFPDAKFQVTGDPTNMDEAQQLSRVDRFQFQWWALSLVHAKPFGAQEGSKVGKKGSDRGIDGIINFIGDHSGNPQQVLVQVKSGSVRSGDIRDLRGTLERERAAIGVFITLENPTSEMALEALSAGFYHSTGWGQDYPRIQIYTVDDLLKGAAIKMPVEYGTFKIPGRIVLQPKQLAFDTTTQLPATPQVAANSPDPKQLRLRIQRQARPELNKQPKQPSKSPSKGSRLGRASQKLDR
ncbi:MAG: DNA methyltransferase [Chloroflexia bacterium]